VTDLLKLEVQFPRIAVLLAATRATTIHRRTGTLKQNFLRSSSMGTRV
jgi:hypothetical protein